MSTLLFRIVRSLLARVRRTRRECRGTHTRQNVSVCQCAIGFVFHSHPSFCLNSPWSLLKSLFQPRPHAMLQRWRRCAPRPRQSHCSRQHARFARRSGVRATEAQDSRALIWQAPGAGARGVQEARTPPLRRATGACVACAHRIQTPIQYSIATNR